MNTIPHGIIEHPNSPRPTDYLFRVSIKCLIRDESGRVLVVKESGRDWWDLPGGGLDHGESVKTAIAREMREEVGMTGDFTYRVVAVEDPLYSTRQNFYQIRLIVELFPETMAFSAGEDGDEVKYIDPATLQHSEELRERQVYEYSQR